MKKIFTLWRIITSNIMMMKKLLFSSFFLLGSLVSQAQHEYTIKVNPEKPDVPLNKNDAFQKVQKRHVQEKR